MMNTRTRLYPLIFSLSGLLMSQPLSATPMVLVGPGDDAANGWALTDSAAGIMSTAGAGVGDAAEVGIYTDDADVSRDRLIFNNLTGIDIKTDTFDLKNNDNKSLLSIDIDGNTNINATDRTGSVTIGNTNAGDIQLITASDRKLTVGDSETLIMNQGTALAPGAVTITADTTNINVEGSRARVTNIGNTSTGSETNIIGTTKVSGATTIVGDTTIDGSAVTINTGASSALGSTVTVGNTASTAGDVTLQSGASSLVVGSSGTVITGGLQVDSLTYASNSGSSSSGLIMETDKFQELTSVGLLFENSLGNSHGIKVSESNTVLSGGTNSTQLTLDDNGAHFANELNAPVKVTGVADGVNATDAINRRQLDISYGGIASVAALAALPPPAPNRHFSIGMGTSYYEGQTGVALGLKGSLADTTQFTLGTSWNSSEGSPLVNGGMSMSW